MIPANIKKYCAICALSVSVLINSEGAYFCERCKHEIHDDEPIHSQLTYPTFKIDLPYSVGGSAASATGPFTVSPSPSAAPDGTN